MLSVLLVTLILSGCAANQKATVTAQSAGNEQGLKIYYSIKEALDNNSDSIDYDTLLWIYKEMSPNQPPVPHSGELLSALIRKKNDNPRIDSMILIFATQTIGNSQAAIDGVYGLFETMLTMDHRLNTWVLYYIGDAIGDYPYNIHNGDRLADLIELKVSHHITGHPLAKEFFGYHFMPPPKGEYIPNYIAGIQDQQTRVLERICYYNLIFNQWTEAQIGKALKQLQTRGIPETGEKTLRPLKYLVQHSNQFQDSSPSSQGGHTP
jgi:hypothetical protein